MKKIFIHLISDGNIDVISSISKEVIARFTVQQESDYLWPKTDDQEKLQDVIKKISDLKNNFIIYDIKKKEIRNELKNFCYVNKIPCVAPFARVLKELSYFLEEKPSCATIEEMDIFTEDYFSRIDAMNYVLSHDDGQNMWNLDEADIIIIGVSRTSKSPTSVYLSYKGYKTANIPFIVNVPLPENLTDMKNKLIVGLSINPDRLIEIRRNRLVVNRDCDNQNYAARSEILNEIRQFRRVFTQNNWPIIDVTNRSVEEIASVIIKDYQLLVK